MNEHDRPPDLISIKEACSLVPSPHGGRGVHLNTMRRWAATGRLRHWRNGRWLLVSRADVLALLQPVSRPSQAEETPDAQDAALDRTAAILARHRIRRSSLG